MCASHTAPRLWRPLPLLLLLLAAFPSVVAQPPNPVTDPVLSPVTSNALILNAWARANQNVVARGGIPEGGFPGFLTINVFAEDQSLHRDAPQAENSDVHTIRLRTGFVFPEDAEARGWTVSQPSPLFRTDIPSQLKISGEFHVSTALSVGAVEAHVFFEAVLFREQNHSQSVTYRQVIPFRVAPSPSADLDLPAPILRAAPDDLVTFPVVIRNQDFYDASFDVTATISEADGIPSDTPILGQGRYYLRAFEERTIHLSFLAPREKFWYREVSSLVFVRVVPAEGGSPRTDVQLFVVNGTYVSPNLWMLLFAALLQVLVAAWFVVLARRRYERRYLGRPVPPWTIPEERANLERLRREDPRAYYVTRHYLMEEEYRSALLWFYAFKKVSAKQLKAEQRAVSLREKAAEMGSIPALDMSRASGRAQRKYARKMARVQAGVDRRLDRLQGKLELNFEADHSKEHKRWQERVAKLQAKHRKPFERTHQKWQAQVAALLKDWEKPFRREKAKHAKRVAAAKEAYAKQVKKADKETYRRWREHYEDWQQEAKLARKEGIAPPPEPELLSSVVGPPELPPPYEEPPKPELPPEPVYQPLTAADLPPEPQLVVPHLGASKYARKARRIERKGHRKIRKLERELAEKLDALQLKGTVRMRAVEKERQRILREADAAAKPSLLDKALRRTPDQVARRQHAALVRGRTQLRIREARDNEDARLERIRLEGVRAEAELEAKIIRERATYETASAAPERQASRERLAALEAELKTVRASNAARLAQEQKDGQVRLNERVAAIERQGAAELEAPASKAPGSVPSPH